MRCFWHGNLPDYLHYHDHEWGRPVVRRPPAVREDLPRRVSSPACPGSPSCASARTSAPASPASTSTRSPRSATPTSSACCSDAGIVRHRGKIDSTINNAQRAPRDGRRVRLAGRLLLALRAGPRRAAGTASTWRICAPIRRPPSRSRISKDLKKRGWTFVGPTTVYAFMQAMGLVNDHLEGCVCRDAIETERNDFVRP